MFENKIQNGFLQTTATGYILNKDILKRAANKMEAFCTFYLFSPINTSIILIV